MGKVKNAETLTLDKSNKKKIEGMGKMKSAETLALDKSKQKKVAKRAKKLKQNIIAGKISIGGQKKAKKISVEQSRGLIYIGHLPHGFYENEMRHYFKQFGIVTNVKVCRSSKSGNSKGFGYVEFSHPEVAKIAAETMNNYLMFKKRITAHYVPYERRPKHLFHGKSSNSSRYSSKVRREKQISSNATIDSKTQMKRSSSRLSSLNKKLQKLRNAGINYDIKPVDLPHGIKQEKLSNVDVNSLTHTVDPYDSDIELKIPLKPPMKSVQSKTSSRKSKILDKSKSTDNTPPNKVLLAKSLDSVKALLSLKTKASGKSIKSTKKVNKTTSIDILRQKKAKQSKRGITKKNKKPGPLNTEIVKKIARELIRKRGDSVLKNVYTSSRRKSKKPLATKSSF